MVQTETQVISCTISSTSYRPAKVIVDAILNVTYMASLNVSISSRIITCCAECAQPLNQLTNTSAFFIWKWVKQFQIDKSNSSRSSDADMPCIRSKHFTLYTNSSDYSFNITFGTDVSQYYNWGCMKLFHLLDYIGPGSWLPSLKIDFVC